MLGTFPDQRPFSTQQSVRASWRLRSQICYITNWKRNICSLSQWCQDGKWQNMFQSVFRNEIESCNVKRIFQWLSHDWNLITKKCMRKNIQGFSRKGSSKERFLVISRCFPVEQTQNQASKMWKKKNPLHCYLIIYLFATAIQSCFHFNSALLLLISRNFSLAAFRLTAADEFLLLLPWQAAHKTFTPASPHILVLVKCFSEQELPFGISGTGGIWLISWILLPLYVYQQLLFYRQTEQAFVPY